MNDSSIVLYFAGNSRLELVRSEFRRGTGQPFTVCIRGKTPGALSKFGSFQWTSGVRAVCAAFLRLVISRNSESFDYCLIGGKGSLAASLDYALSKSPSWLTEMFGSGPQGGPYARRLFRISNPNRKRPGPVAVSVNTQAIESKDVLIVVDGRPVHDPQELICVLQVIEEYESGRSKTTPSESVGNLS